MVTSLKDVHAFSSKWNLQAVFISSFLAYYNIKSEKCNMTIVKRVRGLVPSDDLVQ